MMNRMLRDPARSWSPAGKQSVDFLSVTVPPGTEQGASENDATSTNYERALNLRSAVYEAWQQLDGAIKAQLVLRRYELATLAAARRLRLSYCCVAHGTVLAQRFDEPVVRIAADH